VKVENTGSSEIWKESEEAEVAKTKSLKGKNKPPTGTIGYKSTYIQEVSVV
jgi:hypothetical protein